MNQYSNKYSENDYKNKCLALNLEYIGFYKDKKKGTMIKFICSRHKDKGMQAKDWSHFKSSKRGCPYCAGRYKSTKEFIKEISLINNNIEVIGEYKGSERHVQCKCRLCGNIWNPIGRSLKYGEGCPICGREIVNNAKRKTTEEFTNELKIINPDLEVISEYKNTHTKIKLKCRIDGLEFYGYPANLLNLIAGCPYCSMSLGEKELLRALDDLDITYQTQYKIDGCKYKKPLRFDAFDVINNIAFEYNGEQHYIPVDFSGNNSIIANENFKIIQKRDSIKYKFCKENNIKIIVVPYWERRNIKEYIINKLH